MSQTSVKRAFFFPLHYYKCICRNLPLPPPTELVTVEVTRDFLLEIESPEMRSYEGSYTLCAEILRIPSICCVFKPGVPD